jgi:hypothetical protein
MILVAFAVNSLARPQEDFEGNEKTTTQFVMTFGSINKQTMATESTKFASQCLYDFKGMRVSKKCDVEKPPKCEKGTLVATSVGDDYEMCCCNYSNFS